MRRIFPLLILLLTLAIPIRADASQEFDPEVSLSEINAWYSAKLKEDTEKFRLIPYGDIVRGLRFQRAKRAKALVEKVAPDSVAPQKALALTRLYCFADMRKEEVLAAKRFLAAKPNPEDVYQAHQHLLGAYSSTSDAQSLDTVLREIKPTSLREWLDVMNSSSSRHRRLISQDLGPEHALKTLERIKSLYSLDDAFKAPEHAGLAENVLVNYAIARAELLLALDRREEARKALADAKPRVTAKTINAKMLNDAVVKLGFARNE